jgi:hypothetical protein
MDYSTERRNTRRITGQPLAIAVRGFLVSGVIHRLWTMQHVIIHRLWINKWSYPHVRFVSNVRFVPVPRDRVLTLLLRLLRLLPFVPFFRLESEFFLQTGPGLFVKCACVTLRKMIAFGYDTYTVGKICCCFWILACPWFCRMGRDLGGGVIGPWARGFVRYACITL